MQRYKQYAGDIIDKISLHRYSTMYYPRFEMKDTDIFIITKSHHRMDLLANEYYGDPRYWILIARANNLSAPTIKPPVGIQLRIPYPLDRFEIEDIFTEMQN